MNMINRSSCSCTQSAELKMMMAISKEDVAALKGQMRVWKNIFSYINTMVLQSAIRLRLPDIVHAHPGISLAGLASRQSPSPSDHSSLRRIMRFLAHDGIFTHSDTDPETGETLYGPTSASQYLLTPPAAEGCHCRSLAGLALLQHAMGATSPLASKLTEAVSTGAGTTAFQLVNGVDFWSMAEADPEFNEIFNAAMTCTSNIFLDAVLAVYKDALSELRSLVDVGGGVGATLGRITEVCPNLKGINFDLPHVVAGAPEYPNVVHVGGSMFEEIPKAEGVLLKWVLHNHTDKECLKILGKSRSALPQDNSGKLIIMDIVLDPRGDDEGISRFGDVGLQLDTVMFALFDGKERTEKEWRELLHLGGFTRCDFIQIPAILSIIEAFLY